MASSDQREHTRYPKKLAVEVHVFVLPASQTQAGYEAHGRTIDIGRGGWEHSGQGQCQQGGHEQ